MVGGFAVQAVGAADLADLAQVHDHDAVADVLDHREVVGDEDQRQPVRCLQVLKQVQHLGLHRLTSSAETGSSQMIIVGSSTSERAIEMRWH